MKNIFLLGDRDATSPTHRELDAAIELLPSGVTARWVGTDSPDALRTPHADAVWVVPGSPYRNDAAVYSAISSARISGQPFLGTCGGFQYAVVEFARNVASIADADHAETTPDGGLAPAYIDQLADSGLVIAARADDAGVEVVELPNHRFFLATLFQPQIGSIAGKPLHPVIEAFVAAI